MNYTHIPTISCFYSDEPKYSLAHSEAHFEYEIILVTGGKVTTIINHDSYVMEKKSLIFISRMERHSFVIQQEPYCRYVASISSESIMSNVKDLELISIFTQRPKDFCHVINLSDEAYSLILPQFIRMENELKNQLAFYLTQSISILVSVLIDLFRYHPNSFPAHEHNNMQNIVLKAQRFVNDNFNRKLTLQEIANDNYISRHTLSIAFKDIVGITFKEYLILFRITEAKKLLVTTDLSVDEISEMVGYINVNNFVKIFKSKVSTTPLQYRKQFSSSSMNSF